MVLRKILQPFYTAFVIVTFGASILVCFPLFVLVGMREGHRGRKAIYDLIRLWVRCWLWLTGMPVEVIGKRPPGLRYVVVANHISYLDTLNIFPAIPGYFRPLGKKEISKIPLVGFIYKRVVIMVDRGSSDSRAKSMRLLWRVLHHEGHVIVFPEGTFNETGNPLKEFYDGAFRLAISTQTPIFPMIMPDTVNRWHFSGWWKIWPGSNRVIYLEPVQVAGLTQADVPALKRRVYEEMETALLKYPAR
jgi:1-acyl-sn-glycerol-3-phosphate acyltransferase